MPTELYDKNTKEQYEMLGRFVESFETMVSEVRELCVFLAARDARNAILVQTILHHQVFTAKPLFDVMRALIAEAIKDTLTSGDRGSQKRKKECGATFASQFT